MQCDTYALSYEADPQNHRQPSPHGVITLGHRGRPTWLLVFALLLGMLALPAGRLHAAGTTYYVGTLTDDVGTNTAGCASPTNTTCSLRSALMAAASGADTITFRTGLSGTIRLTQGTLTLVRSVTLTGPGAVALALDGNNAVRVLKINSGVTVAMSGLTIQGGQSGGSGGGIHNEGTLALTNSVVSGNRASGADPRSIYIGGGIWNLNGTLSVTNSTITNNSADYGGGIQNDGTLTVTNSTITGNRATNGGGGIYNEVTVTMSGSTLAGNSATRGGGITNGAGTMYVTNSTLTGNSATDTGGAIANSGSNSVATMFVTNSTITSNSATGGSGGIFNEDILYLKNTIVAGNSRTDFVGVSPTVDNHNLIGGNPKVGPLGNNGGPTQTMALQPGSPAIGGGDQAVCEAWPVNGVDQRGVSRLFARCDIGAYQTLPSAPSTISAWVVGTGAQPGGYGIYQYTGSGWSTVTGAAVRIAVGPDGQPWVINDTGKIDRRVNGAWQQVPGSARDIGVGANGAVWIIGMTAQAGGYTIQQYTGSGWTTVAGAAVRVAVSRDGQPWVVNASGNIYRRVNGAWQFVSGTAREISVY